MRQVILFILLSCSVLTYAQSGSSRSKHLNLKDGMALDGYDAVSYFSNKAEKGTATYSVNLGGAIYFFTSLEHKSAFQKSPEKYLPQYGGWCAFAMGDYGEKVKVDPETFKLVDGKLYLFYNAFFNNTLTSWNKDEKNLKAKADMNWSKIISK